jgi:hypothetical protein
MTQREQANIDALEFRNQLDLLLEQALEMEKQQAEKMYSEEEVRKIAEEVRWHVPATGNPREFTKNFDKWFDQFKKK